MERYRKAVRKRVLPEAAVVLLSLILALWCGMMLTNVPGFDKDAVIAEFWVWGLVLLLPVLGIIDLVMLSKHFAKVREILPDIEEQVENCQVSFNESYFFLRDYFFFLKKPAVIKYSDVRRIHAVKSHRYYKGTKHEASQIFIVLKNGKEYRISKFENEVRFSFGDKQFNEARQLFKDVSGTLKRNCHRSQFIRITPYEYKRNQKRKGE